MNEDRPDQHPDQDWESEMSSEFDRRVRDLRESPLTFEHVRGRAVSIKRRRRTVVAASLVAAAAVITPVAVAASGGFGTDRSSEPPVATQTPTAVDTETPAPPEPEGPGFAYLQDGDLHRADGSVVTLPGDYTSATDLGDRIVATAQADNGDTVVDVVEDGAVVESYSAFNPPIASVTGTYVVFMTLDGELQTVWDDGQKVVADGFDPELQFPMVATGDDCVTSCRVFLNQSQDDPIEVNQDGRESSPAPGVLSVTGATSEGDLVTVVTRVLDDDLTGCSALWDPAEQEAVIEETCDYKFLDVSPDGRYLLAGNPQGDGFGNRWVAVLDTDLTEVARLEIEDTSVPYVRFLDEDTILATAYDGAWTVLTQDVGGEPTTVLGPVPGEDLDPPFVLSD
ncbi:hypothetical protein [Nocardioides dongxiaopingii]|uniref:hypothetical protein n=1 Tax=Nocardioides dongxiaopingii TaxID=2576036 RepID=UPI0010C769BA|nr:hypothetical protein [Nocardioides dongxiaopingii]